MVVVNVINDNDNVPIIYCQPVEVIEDLDQEFEITTINVSANFIMHSYYY